MGKFSFKIEEDEDNVETINKSRYLSILRRRSVPMLKKMDVHINSISFNMIALLNTLLWMYELASLNYSTKNNFT